jgi:eukaryotic-like serine/threonine-protein kinase
VSPPESVLMATSPNVDRQTFLAYLRQSGLLREEQFASIERDYADVIRGRALARLLVEREILTRFQAERLLVGQTGGFILGQYKILEQVGRGGMGRVYKAEHLTMQRVVALKVLAPDLLKTERAVEMFLREVRAVAQLQHPNIVTAYDANEINRRYYLVLEFVDGPNLDQLVRNKGPLSVGLACDYVKQTAAGLHAAHMRGMLHRDIKPANILVQSQNHEGESSPGLIKVSDFGLARLSQPNSSHAANAPAPGTILTRENTVMGTPDYLSPEQSRDLHKTDIRSDLYSLGCMFYFLLTGQVPFPGSNPLDKLIRHATEKPRPIGAFRADVPVEVITLVDRLMAKKPEDRPQTPADLVKALEPFAVSGPIPWAPQRATPIFLDTLATPDPRPVADCSDLFFGPPGSDGEMAAYSPTVTNDLSPTPGPTSSPSSRISLRPADCGASRIKTAVLCAFLVVGGLFILACLTALLGQ